MVNIAFPYHELNFSAMNMALHVLQIMAGNGNEYIHACHSLLAEIKSSIKPKNSQDAAANKDGQVQIRAQAQRNNSNNDTFTERAIAAELLHDQTPAFNQDLGDDPGLWAEVLDSIDIDMDRQWAEAALLRGQQLQGIDELI